MSKSSFLASASLFCALTLMRAQSTIGTPIDLSSIPGNPEAMKSKLSCSLSGLARNPDGKPLAEVQIAAHSVTGTTDRIVTSAGDGGFCIEYLLCGYDELTAKVQGFVSPVPTTLQVSDQQSAPVDVPLAKSDAASSADSSTASDGFLKRFIRAYRDDWNGTAQSGPEPAYRGDPAPVSGPPFPFSIWPYGGSATIGQPWVQSGPLMQALWSGPRNDWWKRSKLQIYGYLNAGMNVSTSKEHGYSNFPEAYAERGNSPELDQEVLYIERQPDTVQTSHVDWGFRLAALYGLDYRFTTAKGYFSNQLLGKNQENGFDLPMMYFDLYIPVAQGMDIRVGRYISLPDIEAQLAPNNYTYSHSLLYTFDAYTQTGINVTTKLSNRWLLQVGLSPGNDVAPWDTRDAQLTLNACLGYTWRAGLDNVYVCDNSLNKGKYAYNNVQSLYFTWYHKLRKSGTWHTATETWYQYERNTPNVNNLAGASLEEVNANGAFCSSATQVTCYAPEYALVNYLEKQLSKHDYLTIRNEFFNDMVGQRTGFKTPYTEHLLGWGHWVGTTVLFRPELRWEHSYALPVYDNGTRHSQLTFGADAIFFF